MQLKRMPFWYVATMQVWDQECRDRIDRHRQRRAGKGFQTVEAPVHLAEAAAALPPDGFPALLECLVIWWQMSSSAATPEHRCRQFWTGCMLCTGMCGIW
ncbi:MAG: bifunctional adenosylcobinamide kinase/adenosylcobinamide-phosphate guanylyltransferase [Ruminococcus sp.]